MTSIPSTLLVVLMIVTGQTLVRGQKYIETLNAKCDTELRFPANPAFEDGFTLLECNPEKYMKCKENGGSYTCKCFAEVDPKEPTKKCLPPAPTQKYKEFCSHLSRCYPPTQCKFGTSTFIPDLCECPTDLPFYDTTLLTCRKLKHGEKGCTKKEDCGTGVCTNGVCSCPANTPNWNTQVKPPECQRKYIGEACKTDDECHGAGGLTCVGSKCTCATGHKINWNDKLKKCDGKKHGEDCVTSDECADIFACWGGKCACAHTTTYDPVNDTCTGLPRHGSHCEKGEEKKGKMFALCAHETLVCDDNEKCKCLYERQVPDDLKLKCFTPLLPGYEETCTTEKGCAISSNLVCVAGKCACASDFAYSRGLCTKKTNVRDCVSNVEDDFCDDPTGVNEACHPKDNICVCPNNMEWAAWAKACKLKTGENCYNQDQPLHDLCAGQICKDEKDPTHPKKCGCKSGEIWSSEPGHGCIPNYFMRYCNEKTGPEECLPKPPHKYNAAREGLVCRIERDAGGSETAVTRCQCKDTLTFMQGYCIDASMSFGEVGCNRRFGKTCKISGPTSLSCMEFGNGTSICLCLPKVIPPQYGASVRVPLKWDESLTKCELKKNSEPCKESYECKSHHCGSNGLCARRTRGAGRKKGGGSPLSVTVNHGMMWLMALVPLSLLTQ